MPLDDLSLEDSTVAGIHGDPNALDSFDPAPGVEVREEDRGVMHYAVFDDDEQVSDTVGPMNEDYILHFVEAYSTAKRRFTDVDEEWPTNDEGHPVCIECGGILNFAGECPKGHRMRELDK